MSDSGYTPSMEGPDYDIPGFWFIQTQREDFDCDGIYPLEPVVVYGEHLDDAMNKADVLTVVPKDCTVTGRLVERRATVEEIADWFAVRDAEVAAKVLDEAIKALEKEGWFSPSIEKIRDQIGENK